jgi:lipopolysaccharide transport system ATP-binding protein
MSKPIIQVNNLSKSYIISHEGQERYTALRDVMANKARKLFSFASTNQQINKSTSKEEFWALKDVSFEIQQGDRVGIIGRNGAGKSTLLKILSRITEPTKGEIRIKGRVASLLEVGTGFHPELTGRENIYLNGAILGMSRAEIKRKFDEIVDFAEVEKFLDTPVKRYSSGMYVRLAFAVAAHLEPEILVVDEVLAVGDAQFQKKCLGKMEDVSKNDGRTVLFVSHNMAAIRNLCKDAIYLKEGKLNKLGKVHEVIDHYLNDSINETGIEWKGMHNNNEWLTLHSIFVKRDKVETKDIYINEEIIICFDVEFKQKTSGVSFELFINTVEGVAVFNTITPNRDFDKGKELISCVIPKNFLNNSTYLITAGISKNFNFFIVKIEDALRLEMLNFIDDVSYSGEYPGVVRPKLTWNYA